MHARVIARTAAVRVAAMLFAICVAPACFDQPNYEGLICSRFEGCPTGYDCGPDLVCHRAGESNGAVANRISAGNQAGPTPAGSSSPGGMVVITNSSGPGGLDAGSGTVPIGGQSGSDGGGLGRDAGGTGGGSTPGTPSIVPDGGVGATQMIVPALLPDGPDQLCSVNSNNPATVSFVNHCSVEIQTLWVDYACSEEFFATVPPGSTMNINTFLTHSWRARYMGGLVIDLPQISTSLDVFLCGQ